VPHELKLGGDDVELAAAVAAAGLGAGSRSLSAESWSVWRRPAAFAVGVAPGPHGAGAVAWRGVAVGLARAGAFAGRVA
jgi:hypothetical protein